MATYAYIYYLYQLKDSDHLLVRVLRPGYSNAKQSDADLAESIAERKMTRIMERFIEGKETHCYHLY